ncbi:MAG: cobalt ECF transporter T component CbiQ [Thermoanaerobaculaceae bacterium]|jgi:cobalt/nickel transport system permease protein|nr:cobalt ECF transporter T component CbiQ [Thermoanaerobaculaceae bacterium]
MRRDFLDPYSRLDSPIHRLGAGTKLGTALGLVVLVLVVPTSRPVALAAVAAALVAIAVCSRVPWRFLAGRVLMLEPLVLGVAGLALLQPGGWRLFLFLLARSTLCLGTMVLLSNTTPFEDLLRVMKAAHMPALLVTTLSLLYRYLFVLVDEAGRMKRARASRTFTRRRAWAWHTGASVVSQLFIRSSERAERIHAAMCARGWR